MMSPSLIMEIMVSNFLFDKEGRPILIDPAIYFGNREAELGMITLLEV